MSRYDNPPGWYFDRGDPSVGIFGEAWIHEACPVEDDGTVEYDTTEALISESVDDNGTLTQYWQIICDECGATFLATEYDWVGPDEEPEEPDWDHIERYVREEEDLARGDDWRTE